MQAPTKITQIQVIVASGRLGSGKNYITENILLPMLPPQPTQFLAFANHFKVEAIIKDGLDREKVFGEKDERTRRALQLRGTEQGRDVYGADHWLNLGQEWMYTYLGLGFTRFIFTDARFPNEIERMHELDGTRMTILGQDYEFQVTSIRAVAPERSLRRAQAEALKGGAQVELIMGHASETALDDFQGFTYVVDNDLDTDVLPAIKQIAHELTLAQTPHTRYVVDVDDTICLCGVYYEAVIELAQTKLIILGVTVGMDETTVRAEFQRQCQVIYANKDHGVFYPERFAEDMRDAFAATARVMGVSMSSLLDLGLAYEVYRAGLAVFDNPYSPLPGALEALEQLGRLGPVVLYTHGDRIEQMTKIARLGLSRLPVFVTPDKGQVALVHLMAAYPALNYVVIGDNYKRDAQPALALKCARVYWIASDPRSQGLIQGAAEQGIIPVNSLAEVAAVEQVRVEEESFAYAR